MSAPVEVLAPAVIEAPPAHPTAHAVEAFLRDNPEFLAMRPDLYRELLPPLRVHGERIADHMAAMLAAERRRLRGLEAQMAEAVQAGRAGGALTMRVRLAVLALMRSQDVVETVVQEVPALLGVETCTLLAEAPDRIGIVKLPRGMVARLLGPGRDAIVRSVPGDLDLLHQEAAGLVNRDALVRVPVWTSQPTLLALGTRDPGALPARQSSATLTFLGRAVAAALAR